MSIGKNIKRFRKSKRLTQNELAKKSNISRSYLADLENERYNPSICVLHALAKSLDITTQQFFKDKIDQEDDIDKLEKEIYSKIKKISKSDKEKILKMIEIFESK